MVGLEGRRWQRVCASDHVIHRKLGRVGDGFADALPLLIVDDELAGHLTEEGPRSESGLYCLDRTRRGDPPAS